MTNSQSSPSSALGVAIIGCGLIGKKRAAALDPSQIKVTCDIHPKLAQTLAMAVGSHCLSTHDSQIAVSHPEVKWVIVATTNKTLAEVTEQAILAKKHVLVEKPGGLSSTQLLRLHTLAEENNVLVRVGFNHRFHPALAKAYEIFKSGELGPLMFLRGRYGHGGRVGYESEWRADPTQSGGGELMDQGVHLIDLAGWFMGDFKEVSGHAATYFWKMPVDDNAFISLRSNEGQTAWLHVSCTEWKNLFSLEIYGRDGKLHIEGLGGSYGIERLSHYHMLPQMGPPETTIYEFPRGDQSWKQEMVTFQNEIKNEIQPSPGLIHAAQSLKVVEKIYRDSGFEVSQET